MSEHRRSLGVYEDVLNQLKAKGIRLTPHTLSNRPIVLPVDGIS